MLKFQPGLDMKKFLLPIFIALFNLMAMATQAQTPNRVCQVAPQVYFYEGDPSQGHSNNGWVVFDDYVLVIDANYPSGAKIVASLIQEITNKPVRFVFDTHHHPDHAYGNKVWADAGATILSTKKTLDEMKKLETGYFGNTPGNWETIAAKRPDMAETALQPPTLLFNDKLVFDDGTTCVDLLWLGEGHTPGDGYAWLPKQKILFTGDGCVNGARNKTEDGNIIDWITTLEKVKKLGAETVCPGHGPMGGPEIIEDQQAYFIELLAQVKKLVDEGKTAAEIKAAIPTIAEELKKKPNIARFVYNDMTRHVQKAYLDLGGEMFPN